MTVPASYPRERQTAIGLGLAGLVIAAWAALHIAMVFFFPGDPRWWPVAPLIIIVQIWLYVGMFIVAHDAMHGSLAPGNPRLNRLIGGLCCALYAGFSLGRLAGGHFDHHRAPGTAEDPDFDAGHPTRFLVWFMKFFRTYFSWREVCFLAIWAMGSLALGAAPLNLVLFWAAPSVLSAAQLFYFGTWLPHRHGPGPFADSHRARSSDFGWLLSLLTCFHFGYHQEHHRFPHLPWWRLPSMRK